MTVEHLPADDGDAEEIPELHQSLDASAQALARTLQSEDFYTLTCEGQTALLEAAVSLATEDAEEIEYFTNVALLVEAEFAYAVAPLGSSEKYIKIILVKEIVAGLCIGLSTLTDDLLFSGDKIEDKNQLVDPDAGLFLVIHPDDHTRACLKLEIDQLTYIPIANQDIAVSFIKSVEQTDD